MLLIAYCLLPTLQNKVNIGTPMKNRWSDQDAEQFIAQYGTQWGADLALRTYTTRLLGSESSLVLHGGGNTSLKGTYPNVFGQNTPALFMKASGFNLGTIEPEGHTPMDLEYLKRMCALPELSDDAMAGEFLTHRLVPNAAAPSIETLSHAYIPAKYVDHTHADAILVLTNQPDGDALIHEALGEGVALVNYVKPGFKLAKRVMAAYDANPGCRALVWMQHGIMTWGETALDAKLRGSFICGGLCVFCVGEDGLGGPGAGRGPVRSPRLIRGGGRDRDYRPARWI